MKVRSVKLRKKQKSKRTNKKIYKDVREMEHQKLKKKRKPLKLVTNKTNSRIMVGKK